MGVRKENDGRAQRFKPHREEADWLTEGGQEYDCTSVMMSALILTAQKLVVM